MNIKINTVHFKADGKLESFIKEKLQKMLSIYEGIIGSEVILKLENTESRENKMVEIRLIVRGYDLFAKKQAKSFEEATDQAIEALKKQLIRHKEKIRGL
ncbi:MAG: ribosome-associated translation inhibitor RaiA [Bacteroidetes bacterium]|nr:ribosome-associated translation inhibitor RaiA [Bacteroidota bacterium]